MHQLCQSYVFVLCSVLVVLLFFVDLRKTQLGYSHFLMWFFCILFSLEATICVQ